MRREGLKEYYYRILNGNAQRLLNLVNELMDFRTVENGMMKLELQPLDINHIVKEIANDFIDYAEQRKIDFQVICDTELPVTIYADRNIVEKIVMNLLNNAFKYTPDNGKILLETRGRKDCFTSEYKNNFIVGECVDDTFSSLSVIPESVSLMIPLVAFSTDFIR